MMPAMTVADARPSVSGGLADQTRPMTRGTAADRPGDRAPDRGAAAALERSLLGLGDVGSPVRPVWRPWLNPCPCRGHPRVEADQMLVEHAVIGTVRDHAADLRALPRCGARRTTPAGARAALTLLGRALHLRPR